MSIKLKKNLLCKFKILFLLSIGLLLNVNLQSQDTITVKAFTWQDPSPEGWGASYKKNVHFPDSGQWRKIIMVQHLKCDQRTKGDSFPCGEWDYFTNTVLHIPKNGNFEKFEIGSFVTPYGKRLKMGGDDGWKWEYDITDYAPILKGNILLETGNNQELLDLTFLFISGKPPRNVISVKNIWPNGIYSYEKLADDSVLQKTGFLINPRAESFSIKARISGHGHFGPQNCCEWDNKTHGYSFGEDKFIRWNVWKDCGFNPIYPQGGTWPFNRAGWCPGTKVDEYDFNITEFGFPNDSIYVDYFIENYKNNGENGGEYRMSHQLFEFGNANFSNDAEILEIIAPSNKDEYSRINPVCNNPVIKIRNSGKNVLYSLKIAYGSTNSKNTFEYQWKGNLKFMETTEITLPEFNYSSKMFFAELLLPNGEIDENKENNKLHSLVPEITVLPKKFIIHLQTNDKGRAKENQTIITNSMGNPVFSANNYSDSTEYNHQISLTPGCYKFRFIDKLEDGMVMHWWYWNSNRDLVGRNGKISILDFETKKEIINFPYDFGQELLLNFVVE